LNIFIYLVTYEIVLFFILVYIMNMYDIILTKNHEPSHLYFLIIIHNLYELLKNHSLKVFILNCIILLNLDTINIHKFILVKKDTYVFM